MAERSDTRRTEESVEEATTGRPSEHEREVVRERGERREVDKGDWPGEPGDPPGAGDTGH